MIKHVKLAMLAALLCACASQAPAPAPAPQTMLTGPLGVGESAAPEGYLAPGEFDILSVLPPAPVKGDARDANDRAVFRDTRRLEGSARWAMASDDASLTPADMLRHFSCAVDANLAPENVPRTVQLLQKATTDAARAMTIAKARYQRQRPFWIDPGNTCRPRDELGNSFDYPSGHAMIGWTTALILSQEAPARSAPIRARGRAYAASRVLCGVHNATAVEAGIIGADALMAQMTQKPPFMLDLAAARTELEAVLHKAPKPNPARCAAETTLIEQRWSPVPRTL